MMDAVTIGIGVVCVCLVVMSVGFAWMKYQEGAALQRANDTYARIEKRTPAFPVFIRDAHGIHIQPIYNRTRNQQNTCGKYGAARHRLDRRIIYTERSTLGLKKIDTTLVRTNQTFLQKFPFTQIFPQEHLFEAGQSHAHQRNAVHRHVRVRLSPVHLHLLEHLHRRPSVMHRPETVRALVEEARLPVMECSMVMPVLRATA